MEVLPGRSLGAFQLGDTIGSVLSQLVSTQSLKYETNFLFDDKAPYDFDMVLDLKDVGMQLRFDPLSQRLWTIDVYDIGKVNLAYAGETFSGPKLPTPTLRVLYRLFGPTFPGKFDTDLDSYILSYRGLSFAFPVPHQAVKPQEIPLTLPDGTEPLATRLLIHVGPDLRKIDLPREMRITDCHAYISLHICGSNGACVGFTVQMLPSNCLFQYNDTVQHVLSELGMPSSTYDKLEDKMKIHRKSYKSIKQKQKSSAPDYFFNYFDLGMDILFDGKTHTVKKVVVHTNIPGQSDFNQYRRCHYHIIRVKTNQTSFAKYGKQSFNDLSKRFKLEHEMLSNDADQCESSRETSPVPLMQPQRNSLICVLDGSDDSAAKGPTESTTSNLPFKKKKKKKKKKASTSSNADEKISLTLKDERPKSVNGAAKQSSSSIGFGITSKDDFIVQNNTPWSEIEAAFGKAVGPMIRAPSDAGKYDSSGRMCAPSPFPATKLYAYNGIIYEILQNEFVSNVTLFCTASLN